MMEGKRFGIGLAAGILLALAIVAASGSLGSTPFASFAPAALSTTTVATSTVTTSTTTVFQSVTSAVPTTTATSGGTGGLLTQNSTYPYNTVSSSSTTFISTATSASTTTNNSTPGSQTAAANVTSATSGTPFSFLFPPGTKNPTQVASIARQPAITNAEILAPVLVAFLLGAFLYRVVLQERVRPSED